MKRYPNFREESLIVLSELLVLYIYPIKFTSKYFHKYFKNSGITLHKN